MASPFAVVGRALHIWWHEPFTFILLNIGWLAMQIPVVTGPAATAALYAAAQRVVHEDYLTLRAVADDFKRLFVPALGWGAINLIIIMVILGNFWAYQAERGLVWTALRALWSSIGLGWLAVNTFYWPFWLEQQQPTVRSTLLNGLLLLGKRPFYALVVVLITLAVIVSSVLLTLPFGAFMMTWVALIGSTAVDEELARVRASAHANVSPEQPG